MGMFFNIKYSFLVDIVNHRSSLCHVRSSLLLAVQVGVESVLSCASWCGICELLCLLFGSNPAILRVFVPSLLSCFLLCNMGNAASSSRASPTDEALRPVFKSFFLQVVWETPSFERKVFQIFSPLQDCG